MSPANNTCQLCLIKCMSVVAIMTYSSMFISHSSLIHLSQAWPYFFNPPWPSSTAYGWQPHTPYHPSFWNQSSPRFKLPLSSGILFPFVVLGSGEVFSSFSLESSTDLSFHRFTDFLKYLFSGIFYCWLLQVILLTWIQIAKHNKP